MKSHARFMLLCIIASMCASSGVFAQPNPWSYVGKITFPVADSIAARPYLCTLDQNERLYVISAKVDDAKAHNAVYFANPGDTVFTRFIDYDVNGDSDTLMGNIGALRGITTLKNDLIVTASQPYPKTKPNTLAAAYYYRNADTNTVERFGFNIAGSGYGSFINSADMSKDSMLIAGIDFGTSIRWYNWGTRFTKSARGSWNTPDTNNTSLFSNATEPGGPQTSGLDLIRDVALIPGADYFSTSTSFYTSRNSISGTQVTGGIAVWKGGTQIQAINYVPARVSDFDGFLSFMEYFPYGITVDTREILWVAGIDSTRRWVKGFKVEGVNALAMYDLPSQNSSDVPTTNGAPMLAPSDVAVTRNMQYAYVIDRYARCAWKFKSSSVGVQDDRVQPSHFALSQNFPNPFNPSTIISFVLPAAGYVRLTVTDMLGREVRRVVDGYAAAGKHAEVFDAANLPSGTYLYTLITPTSRSSRKMLYLK
jgi:hypothetical protein